MSLSSLSLAVFLVAATPALADASWSQQTTRGLNVYDISMENGYVTLTCDPDRLFGDSSNGSLRVDIDGVVLNGQLVLLSNLGNQAVFTATNGMVPQFSADEEEWLELAQILSAGGSYAFVTSTGSITLDDVDPIADLNCQ